MSTTTAPESRAACSARDISAAVLNCSLNRFSSSARAFWPASRPFAEVVASVVADVSAASSPASCAILAPSSTALRPRKIPQLQQFIHLRQHRFHALPNCLAFTLQALQLLRGRVRACCLRVHLFT